MDYIKLSSDEIADEIDAIANGAKADDYEVIIIADHGNADHALNEDGTPNTATGEKATEAKSIISLRTVSGLNDEHMRCSYSQ